MFSAVSLTISCSDQSADKPASSGTNPEGKAIVIYFSHTGENYSVGVITEGNTAKVAKVIAAKAGARRRTSPPRSRPSTNG